MSAGQTILGLDPGVRTGVAIYVLGRLQTLRTIPPDQIGSEIAAVFGLDGIVYEDSRQGTIWTTHRNPRAALKMARNVGEIDGWCRMIVQAAERLGVPALGVSPRQKGRKLDAGELCTLTGWAGRSNQHERDAAAVAWPYRSGWKR